MLVIDAQTTPENLGYFGRNDVPNKGVWLFSGLALIRFLLDSAVEKSRGMIHYSKVLRHKTLNN